MTEQQPSDRLPAAAEQLLDDWPQTRSDADLERMARAIEARLGGDAVDEEWALRPPLPLQPGEPRVSSEHTTEDSLSGLSLREVARAALHSAAVSPPTPIAGARAPLESFTGERSGALGVGGPETTDGVHQARASAVSRVNVIALSSRRRTPARDALPAAAAAATAAAAAVPARGAREPASSGSAATENENPRGAQTRRGEPISALRRVGLWSALGVAAGGLLLVGSLFRGTAPADAPGHAQQVTAPPPAASQVEARPAKESQATTSPLLTDDTREPSATAGVAPTPTVQPQAEARPPAKELAELPHVRQKPRPPAPDTAASTQAVEAQRADAPPSPALPAEPRLVPAARSSGQAERPSIGAAQGAVGSVLGRARACVAGQFSPSKATVVFGPDGRVRDVVVSGPAQGTPAEACIISAMKGARVKPFTDDAFSVRTTVRP